jgi:hypothetical protein
MSEQGMPSPRTSLLPSTRAEGKPLVTAVDPDTNRVYTTVKTNTGRLVEKNRSNGWRGYKSHLTRRQKQIIRWYLRQRDRGCSRERCWIALQEADAWVPQPMQYPLTFGTLASWELTRSAERAKGRDWPQLSG